MAAAGRVCTGFSKPYVALYSASSGTVTYSSGALLGRGVEVSVEAEEASEANNFYADNVIAESISGVFSGGTATLTVDGLLDATRKLIYGLPAADGDGWTHFGDSQAVPYVGIGFVTRYMSEGVTTYVPTILTKAIFQAEPQEAATQEDEVEFQTTELTATLLRDDSSNHDWKMIGEPQTSEALAEAEIKDIFNIA
jgi:phi13 family phage major tail protein